MRRIPFRYSPSHTNVSSSYRSVATSSVLLLETPSLTSFQVNGSLRNSSWVFIVEVPLVLLLGQDWDGKVVPADAGIQKAIGVVFPFAGEEHQQVAGKGLL